MKGTPGPMAADVDGLAILMDALLADGLMHELGAHQCTGQQLHPAPPHRN